MHPRSNLHRSRVVVDVMVLGHCQSAMEVVAVAVVPQSVPVALVAR